MKNVLIIGSVCVVLILFSVAYQMGSASKYCPSQQPIVNEVVVNNVTECSTSLCIEMLRESKTFLEEAKNATD